MQSQFSNKSKTIIVGLVTIFIFSVLFWEHYNGGVKSHHFLNQKEMPSISNWWGGILLPLLSWFLLGRIEKRLLKQEAVSPLPQNTLNKIISVFFTGLAFGVMISIAFTNQYKPFLDNVPYLLIALCFVMPLYYSEFILGFILAMTFTFGALLPTLFILVIAIIGFVIFKIVRPQILNLLSKIRISQ